jgi:hypothetical protein
MTLNYRFELIVPKGLRTVEGMVEPKEVTMQVLKAPPATIVEKVIKPQRFSINSTPGLIAVAVISVLSALYVGHLSRSGVFAGWLDVFRSPVQISDAQNKKLAPTTINPPTANLVRNSGTEIDKSVNNVPSLSTQSESQGSLTASNGAVPAAMVQQAALPVSAQVPDQLQEVQVTNQVSPTTAAPLITRYDALPVRTQIAAVENQQMPAKSIKQIAPAQHSRTLAPSTLPKSLPAKSSIPANEAPRFVMPTELNAAPTQPKTEARTETRSGILKRPQPAPADVNAQVQKVEKKTAVEQKLF